MTNRIVVFFLVCFLVAFIAGNALAADSSMDEQMTINDQLKKNVMMAADKILKMAPDMGFYRFDVKDLKMKVDSGTMDFVIIDVRMPTSFAAEHINMAINIPLPLLIDKLIMIPKDKTIYVVCALDSNSSYATAILRMLGYDAYMIPGGEGAWKMAGYPLVMGNI